MATNLASSIYKLIQALNLRGYNICYSTKQFIGRDGRTIKMHILEQGVWEDTKQRYENVLLYKSASILRVLFYLRDLWFSENGWDLPMDNEQWNAIRESIREGHNG